MKQKSPVTNSRLVADMTARRILAVIGSIAMVVGVTQIVTTDTLLRLWRPLIVGDPFAAPPREIYIMGAISVVLGIFLLYTGIKRLVHLSWLVAFIGVLSLIVGALVTIAPDLFRDTINSMLYAQPERTRLTINYVSGAIRVVVGLIFLIIGLRSAPERQR